MTQLILHHFAMSPFAGTPQVPLYPAAHQGLAEIVAQWADSALFPHR